MIFHLSHFSNLEIHPKTIRYITGVQLITKSLINNKQTNTIFYEILTEVIHQRL